MVQGAGDLVTQTLLVEQVLHPDPDAGDLSPYAGPIPRPVVPIFFPANRSVTLSSSTWYGAMMCVGTDHQTVGADPAGLQALHLPLEHGRVDDNPLAMTGTQLASRCLTATGATRTSSPMTTVCPALLPLVAHDVVDTLTEDVCGLALALVAPLGAHEHDRRHLASSHSRKEPTSSNGVRVERGHVAPSAKCRRNP